MVRCSVDVHTGGRAKGGRAAQGQRAVQQREPAPLLAGAPGAVHTRRAGCRRAAPRAPRPARLPWSPPRTRHGVGLAVAGARDAGGQDVGQQLRVHLAARAAGGRFCVEGAGAGRTGRRRYARRCLRGGCRAGAGCTSILEDRGARAPAAPPARPRPPERRVAADPALRVELALAVPRQPDLAGPPHARAAHLQGAGSRRARCARNDKRTCGARHAGTARSPQQAAAGRPGRPPQRRQRVQAGRQGRGARSARRLQPSATAPVYGPAPGHPWVGRAPAPLHSCPLTCMRKKTILPGR